MTGCGLDANRCLNSSPSLFLWQLPVRCTFLRVLGGDELCWSAAVFEDVLAWIAKPVNGFLQNIHHWSILMFAALVFISFQTF